MWILHKGRIGGEDGWWSVCWPVRGEVKKSGIIQALSNKNIFLYIHTFFCSCLPSPDNFWKQQTSREADLSSAPSWRTLRYRGAPGSGLWAKLRSRPLSLMCFLTTARESEALSLGSGSRDTGLSLVESIVLLAPALLCHKDTSQGTQSPPSEALGRNAPLLGISLPSTVSLWHKGPYNRSY